MPEDDPDDAPLSDLADRVASRRREGDASPRDGAVDPSDGTPREPPAAGEAGDAEGEPAPLSDLARRVGERRRRESGSNADSNADADALFDEMSVGEVDEEALWASLADSESAEATHVGAGADASVEEVREDVPGYADHLVPKAEFCAQCPYLSDPPELACDHEGTEIVEVPDSETFRVRDCPMVDDE